MNSFQFDIKDLAYKYITTTIILFGLSDILLYLTKACISGLKRGEDFAGLGCLFFSIPIIYIFLPIWVIYSLVFIVKKLRAKEETIAVYRVKPYLFLILMVTLVLLVAWFILLLPANLWY